ncbi:beta strand repeat-containing protein [Chryseobacterium shandongense]|nr:hypothetical protein [Chryseobacterium shandongense]
MIKKILSLYGLFFLFWLQAQSPGGVSANLVGWYSADVSATATTWIDRSPAGNNLTGAGTPTFTNLLNFNTVATFNGTSQRYSIAATSATWPGTNTANTYYYVAVPTGTNTSRSVFGKGTGTTALNGMHSGKGTTATTLVSGATGAGTVNKTSVWSQNVPKMIRTGFNGGTTGAHYLSDNGASESSAGSSNPTYAATSAFAVGSQNTAAGFWDGNIAEVIAYSGKHAAADYNRIESYLAVKYGITKAGNYINSASTTVWTTGGGYDNNIAGIGRDDLGGAANSGLNQKQSQSANSGSQVVMALGTAAASNAANANTFTANQRFFIWGDDNGSLTTQVATGSNAYTYRFTRIWKTENTGSFAQNMTVYYPVSAFGNALASGVSLLYGTSAASLSDGTASTIAQSGTTTINGASYYVFTVPSGQIANMQFFSFTGTISSPGGVSTNLRLWLRADAGTNTTTDGGSVTSWNDQSGFGRNAGNANLVNFRSGSNTKAINFNPVVDFANTASRMYNITGGLASTTSALSHLFLTSGIPSGGLSNEKIYSGYSTSFTTGGIGGFAEGGSFRATMSAHILASGSTFTTLPYTPSLLGTNAMIAIALDPGGSAIRLRQNGLQSGILTSTGTRSADEGYVLGDDQFDGDGGNPSAKATIGDAIAYEANLTGTDLSKVESYLAIKYSMTLGTTASTVSYLNSAGTTTWTGSATYQNNVAGIGRDDLTALYQKQSQSVNSGSQVVMALGTVAASNQVNANTIPTDKQFFIWGDDNGSISNIVTTGNTIYPYRFTRVWKTQNTGSFAQNMTVYYPVSAFGNASSTTVALLYGTSAASLSNGTASAIAQSGTTTINGASYYVFTVPSAQVANMQFFSFAGTQTSPGGVLAGLKIWHKADAGVTATANAVTAWDNQADGTQVINTVASERPTLTNGTATAFNFNPYLDFTATTNTLYNSTATPFTTDGDITFFTATKPEASGGSGQFFAINATPATTGGSSYDSPELRSSNVLFTGGSTVNYSPDIRGTDQCILTFYHNGATNSLNAFRNLVTVINNAAQSGALGSGGYVFGSSVFAGDGQAAPIAQVSENIAYNRVLSATELQRVQTYLAIKTGVTLNQNHLLSDGTTIAWDAASNSSYANNIAGIGRDDLSALYQKQSQSVNTGSQVVMALGTVATTNQANANTIPTDKQFFIWGDDSGSLTTMASTGNSTYTYRFTRVWKTQNTGSFAQNLTVYYPVSAFGNALPATVALLYGTSAASLSNGTASAIAQSSTTTINGTNYYVFTVPSAQIANMQFFSFAGTQTAPGGVTGTSLWLKSDAGTNTTTNGGTVTAWNDQSGNNKNFSNAAGTVLYQTPLSNNKFNFNPSLNFSTTATSLSSSSSLFPASPVSSATLFGVSNTDGFISLRVNNSSETNGFAFYDYPIFGANFIFARPNFSSSVSASDTSVSGNIGRISIGSLISGTSVSVSVNGGGATSSAGAYSTNTGGMTIGSNTWAGGDDPGIIGNTTETIAYTQLLTLIEQQRVNTYLAVKYGITLSRNNDGDGTSGEVISGSILEGDYVASNGTTRIWNSDATYQNNIAGIGRDDLSTLYQKQSQSVNTGSQVVMALGTVATTNQANANTIPTDKQFFIWGDDSGSLTTMASTGNSTYTYRFTRVWKAQNTGSFAENMTVYYPVSAFGNALSTTVALLYGTSAASLSNGTASAIAQSGTTTINGTSYYVFTVPSAQVANMQFFSFAGTQTAPGGVMTNLTLWLKGDAGTSTTTDGATVSTWANSVNADVNDGGVSPTYSAVGANFNPAIVFNGSNNFLRYDNVSDWGLTGTNNFNIYSVVKQDVQIANNTIISANPLTGTFQYVLNNNTQKIANQNSSFIFSGSTSIGILPNMLQVKRNGSTFQSVNNGINDATGTSSFNFPATATSMRIGSRADGSQVFDGNMSEIIVYGNTANTSTEENRIQSYLSIKYGTTFGSTATPIDYLASDGTTKMWDATANAAYQNNIAGIGRDDLSALYQKQSQSVNSGSHVVMALGTAAVSNQANANTIPTDKQFFIWGDDNGSLSNIVATSNTIYPYRFTRIWKTQNTGSFAQNSTVYYPVSTFGNAQASTIALLYGTSAASLSNGTATAIAQSGTTTINGVNYYVFTVPSGQISNMQFFSFTGTITSPGGVLGESLWYKADAGVNTSGSNVTQWDNYSGSGLYHQVLETGTPVYNTTSSLVNYNPSVRFTAIDALHALSVPVNVVTSGSSPYNTSQYIVYRSTTGGNNALYYHSPGGLATWNIGARTSGFTVITNKGNTGVPAPTAGIGRLQAVDGDNVSGATYINGVQQSTTWTGTETETGTQPLTFGYSDADVAEFIVYNSAQGTNRNRIETYLGLKYGLTIGHNYLVSDGTTVWDAASNSSYANNIAGIGRDDLSALYQKQSQSVNSGSHVVMALGTAAVSNQANANTIPTDKQFFIWGDDNGSLSTFVSTGNITYPSRFTRIWKVQNTGSFAQNMTVYYPVSAFGTSLASYVGMIYGSTTTSLSNGSASVIPQSGTTTINGVSYYIFTVPSGQVSGMQFFSFTGNSICYKPGVTVGTTLDTKHGITSLSRAGTSGDNWPMVRKGAWTVLEAKTKGFVINRLTAAQIAAIPPANLVEGMMVYDTTNNCMKVYTSTDGGTTFNWQCITTQTCPD